ncbi:MAG TPA: FG-GAP-like repeat-containing protein [Acidimicrobiales bacterium]|nr:FG-GAP-like repeat-containing protein [Acidimicrobiales bacterium]
MTNRLSMFAAVAALAVALTPAAASASDPSPRPALSFAEPRAFATHAVPPSADNPDYKGDEPANSRVPNSDGLTVGNFDEDPDGHLDAVQTNVLAGSISVFRGDGRGGFSEPTVIPVGIAPAVVLTRDLDRDSHLDLVIADPATNSPTAAASPDAAVITMRGDGHGGFAVGSTIPLSPPPRDLALGDVNADGVSDIVVASRRLTSPFAPLPSDGGVTILTGSLDGANNITFGVAQTMLLTKADEPVGANAVVLGDFDGVGGDDLAVGVGTLVKAGDRPLLGTEPEGDDLLVYINRNAEGAAFASTPSQRLRVGAMPIAIAAADWNDDAHVDLAVLDNQSGDVTTLNNNGAGSFAVKQVNRSVGALPRSLKVTDFNRDGVADLATATYLMSTVSVLQGHGDGTFDPAVDFWAGDQPTSVEVGLFDDDNRPDIVAGRVGDDTLALLVNETPRPSDGVVATRDIPYVASADDPTAAHHTLDVWTPSRTTPSFAGRGKPYPVVMFAHGGAGISGDKTMVASLMRSLARAGIVGVSIDYRLDGPAHYADTQAEDYANAFRWVRANIGLPRFGGDPENVIVAGTSQGAATAARFASAPIYAKEHWHILGLFVVGVAAHCVADAAAGLPPRPSLAVSGDHGGEADGATNAQRFAEVVQARGAYGKFVQVPNRDHFTVVSNLARSGDPGRTALLEFLQRAVR